MKKILQIIGLTLLTFTLQAGESFSAEFDSDLAAQHQAERKDLTYNQKQELAEHDRKREADKKKVTDTSKAPVTSVKLQDPETGKVITFKDPKTGITRDSATTPDQVDALYNKAKKKILDNHDDAQLALRDKQDAQTAQNNLTTDFDALLSESTNPDNPKTSLGKTSQLRTELTRNIKALREQQEDAIGQSKQLQKYNGQLSDLETRLQLVENQHRNLEKIKEMGPDGVERSGSELVTYYEDQIADLHTKIDTTTKSIEKSYDDQIKALQKKYDDYVDKQAKKYDKQAVHEANEKIKAKALEEARKAKEAKEALQKAKEDEEAAQKAVADAQQAIQDAKAAATKALDDKAKRINDLIDKTNAQTAEQKATKALKDAEAKLKVAKAQRVEDEKRARLLEDDARRTEQESRKDQDNDDAKSSSKNKPNTTEQATAAFKNLTKDQIDQLVTEIVSGYIPNLSDGQEIKLKEILDEVHQDVSNNQSLDDIIKNNKDRFINDLGLTQKQIDSFNKSYDTYIKEDKPQDTATFSFIEWLKNLFNFGSTAATITNQSRS